MLRVAINGFGRIGKNFFCALFQDQKALEHIELVAVNGYNQDPEVLVHNLKYDTLLGQFPHEIKLDGNVLQVAGKKIKLLEACSPADCQWQKLAIDWVVDCSGCYTQRECAQEHIDAGAKKVLISAPAQGEDITIVPGVNEQMYNAEKDSIVSLGSCTTNAIVPMLKVLNDTFTITSGFMTSIHAYTNAQSVLDAACKPKDLRRHRAAALNIIPTTTGAAKAIQKVLPELEGKIQASALRVPVGKVSLIDFTFTAQEALSVKKINDIFQAPGAFISMDEIIAVCHEQLVSSDFMGNGASVIIDAGLTSVSGGQAKVFGWYDNEWAYSKRMKDFLLYASR